MPTHAEPLPQDSIARIRYAVELQYRMTADADLVLHVAAAHTPQQRVSDERVDVVTGEARLRMVSDVFGNRTLRVHAAPPSLVVRYGATVEVTHHLAMPGELAQLTVDALPDAVLPFLRASRYCPSDRLQKLAWAEFGGFPAGYERVKAIETWVRERTRFQPGASRADTSALETLLDGAGVCRDFAHLMIALCRAMTIPARIVTGVDYGADPSLGPPDFHAYVEAFLGGRWYLFDPTGISPLTGLIRIGTGRDAADVAFATMFGPVEGGMPRVEFDAVLDDAGRGRPITTRLAVSTAGCECESAAACGEQPFNLGHGAHAEPCADDDRHAVAASGRRAQ
jgi:transglutaminase-like putative cysteine protease